MQYNFTHELSELLHFTAGVGTAARLFSAYSEEFAKRERIQPQIVLMNKENSEKNRNFFSRFFKKQQPTTPRTMPEQRVFGGVVMSMESSQDLMWITDSIHNFNDLAHAIDSGDPNKINAACDRFISYFQWLTDHDQHANSNSKGNPAITFSKDRFKGLIEIERAIGAVNSIKSKLLIKA